MNTRCLFRHVVPTLLMLQLAASLSAGDWTLYRGDSGRSGHSAESLAFPLRKGWTYRSSLPPSPAWPGPAPADLYHGVGNLAPTMANSPAYHPVVSGGLLYFGSSSDDTVYCLDAATGETRWSFTTEGPVRLTPAVAEGKVYAGSDDGTIYCLDAGTGAEVWRYRAGPADRRLPGNGRIISLWPIRGGMLVDEGQVYFSAGVFPTWGTYLCAVDARNGTETWKKDIGVPAQGHMAVSPDRLFVSTGRSAPKAYDRRTGEHVADFGGGGSFGLLSGDIYAHGGGERSWSVHLVNATSGEKIISSPGTRLAVSDTVVCVLNGNTITTYDRTKYIDQRKAEARWAIQCSQPVELIVAENAVLVGADNTVSAYSLADGKVVWTAEVEGNAHGLAVAGGRLFVSTDRGVLHCFGPGADDVIVERKEPDAAPYPEDAATALYGAAAEMAVANADAPKGYCLVLNAGDGRLAYEIAVRSKLRVIGVEEDQRKIAKARERLSAAGIYGSRVVMHRGKPERLPYRDYVANLVVSFGQPTLAGAEAFRVVRPNGGVLLLMGAGDSDKQDLVDWGSKAVPGWKVDKANGVVCGRARRGRLPRSGSWSHQYADPGNTACSGDDLVNGAMDLQWFGRPGPRRIVDRHNRPPAPLYAAGRLFISGMDYVVGLDAYNGTVLWEKDVPGSLRTAVGKYSGNMAAAEDSLYVAAEDKCLALDSRTGEEKTAIALPSGAGKEWGYVAVVGDILLGSVTRPEPERKRLWQHSWKRGYLDNTPVVCSESIHGIDREIGRVLWSYVPKAGVIVNPAIAASAKRVYFVESTNPASRDELTGRLRAEILLGKGADLVALDIPSGKYAWRRSVTLPYSHNIYLSCAGEILLASGTRNGPQGAEYGLFAFDAATGNPKWDAVIVRGGAGTDHGEQDQHPAIVGDTVYLKAGAVELKTGKRVAGWNWTAGGCGTISASMQSIFKRDGNPTMRDLKTGEIRKLVTVTRPGCWINIIPAGGLVLVPEGSSGCVCAFPVQTSMALAPRRSDAQGKL